MHGARVGRRFPSLSCQAIFPAFPCSHQPGSFKDEKRFFIFLVHYGMFTPLTNLSFLEHSVAFVMPHTPSWFPASLDIYSLSLLWWIFFFCLIFNFRSSQVLILTTFYSPTTLLWEISPTSMASNTIYRMTPPKPMSLDKAALLSSSLPSHAGPVNFTYYPNASTCLSPLLALLGKFSTPHLSDSDSLTGFSASIPIDVFCT